MGEAVPLDPSQRAAWCGVLRNKLTALWGAEEYFERSLLAGLLPEVLFDHEQRAAHRRGAGKTSPRGFLARLT